jgi:hypothetical protein
MTMKLSEAILLGDVLKKGTNDAWISEDGSCGCAFGGALLAAGITAQQFRYEMRGCRSADEPGCVKQRWPWLTEEHLIKITGLYDRVMKQCGTIEQVADYVRSIEPAEPTQAPSHAETFQDLEADVDVGQR